MNSLWHLYISFAKSLIRLIGYGILMGSGNIHLQIGGGVLALAEILGILEEIRDER
jgi:hypothetical protein